jgi:hypothetical protein
MQTFIEPSSALNNNPHYYLSTVLLPTSSFSSATAHSNNAYTSTQIQSPVSSYTVYSNLSTETLPTSKMEDWRSVVKLQVLEEIKATSLEDLTTLLEIILQERNFYLSDVCQEESTWDFWIIRMRSAWPVTAFAGGLLGL